MNIKTTENENIEPQWKPHVGDWFMWQDGVGGQWNGPFYKSTHDSAWIFNEGIPYSEDWYYDDGYQYRPFYGTIEVTP